MKAFVLKNLALLSVCAAMAGASATANADRYVHHLSGRYYVGHTYYGPRYGVDVVIGAPPVVVDPYYVAPAYVAPSVVIGGYWGRGYYGPVYRGRYVRHWR